MQPKKVFIAHSWIDVSINIQTKHVAYELSKAAQVWFFTQSRIRQPLPDNKNLKVVEWPNKRPTKFKDFLFAIRYVKNIQPDIIIVHFAATKVMLLAGWLFGIKYRVSWYHTLAEQAQLEAGGKLKSIFDLAVRTVTYKLATQVITFSPYASYDAVNRQHIHPDKIHIIPNGMHAPVERRVSYNFDNPVLTFLYVGRITYTKGCDLLVPVFKKLCSTYNNVALHFVGSGDAEVQLQSLIKSENLQLQVLLKGTTGSYNAVYENMSAAFALLVPSRVDNFPTVIIEAMACGLPVIGANSGGIPFMIEHSENGFICNDEKDWIEKCELLISNIDLRNKMAAHARDAFEKKYAIERHVENVMNFIDGLAD